MSGIDPNVFTDRLKTPLSVCSLFTEFIYEQTRSQYWVMAFILVLQLTRVFLLSLYSVLHFLLGHFLWALVLFLFLFNGSVFMGNYF